MVKRNRIVVASVAALLLLLSFTGERRADFVLAMERPGDLAPAKVQAAVDLGLFAVSVLVTWSKRLTY